MEPMHTRGISSGKFISELGSSAPLLHASMYFIGCSACPGNITAPVDWYTKLTKCATSGCLRVVFLVVVVVVEVMTRQLYLAIVQSPVTCTSMFSTSFSEREFVTLPRKTISAIIDRIRFLQTIRANESQILAWQLNMFTLYEWWKSVEYLCRRLIGWWCGSRGSLSCETIRENDQFLKRSFVSTTTKKWSPLMIALFGLLFSSFLHDAIELFKLN